MVTLLKENRDFRKRLGVLGLLLGWLFLAPVVARYDPDAQLDPAANRYAPPSAQHWFGTDQFGRDVFARVLYGGRTSLLIALSVVSVSVLLGTVYGASAGYFGGVWDRVLMRIADGFLAFPVLFLIVTCVALFGTGLKVLILVLAFTGWMDVARLVRAEVQALKHAGFVVKARALGLATPRVVGRHLVPNVLPTVWTVAVMRVADIILIESALSFLGLGVQPPTASWGALISDGRAVLASAWWVAFFPGVALVMTTVAFHRLGESLRSIG